MITALTMTAQMTKPAMTPSAGDRITLPSPGRFTCKRPVQPMRVRRSGNSTVTFPSVAANNKASAVNQKTAGKASKIAHQSSQTTNSRVETIKPAMTSIIIQGVSIFCVKA